MANTSKSNNQRASSKESPNQKENRSKRNHTIKPDPNDSISMSSKLIKKRTDRKSSRLKRKTENAHRILANGKPMPSLADLEKMYEDSNDREPNNSSNNESLKSYEVATRPKSQECQAEPESLWSHGESGSEHLFSSTTPPICTDEQLEANNLFSNCEDVKAISPQRKKLKFEMQCDEPVDLPPVIISPQKSNTIHSDLLISGDKVNEPCEKTLTPCVNLIESNTNVERPITNDENLSTSSSDSNKTIEYSLTVPKLKSDSVYQSFSPLPSTSKDDKTFNKNDELFFESLKEINNNFTKDDLIKCEMGETTPVTILIDDETMKEPPIDISTEIDYEVQIIDSPIQINSTSAADRTSDTKDYSADDEDDCILLETIDPSTGPVVIDIDEIIDVEAMVAKNRAILDQYKTTDFSDNLVIDVDFPTNAKNIANTQNNNQVQTSNDCQIVDMSQYSSETLNTKPINSNQTQNPFPSNQNTQIITAQEVSNFFTNVWDPTVTDCIYTLPISDMKQVSNNLSKTSTKSPDNNTVRDGQIINPDTGQNRRQPGSISQIRKYLEEERARALNITEDDSSGPKAYNLGDCPICLEKLTGKVIGSTICGHVFCMPCLKQAIKATNRCPTCRKFIRKNGYHKIFL